MESFRIQKKTEKTPKTYYCESCNFISSNKKDYERHKLTAKHKRIHENTINYPINPLIYICSNCTKSYKYHSGLWKHKQKCNLHKKEEINEKETEKDESQELQKTDENDVSFKEMFLELMKQNQELQKTVVDQQKQYTDTINEMIPKIGNNNNTTNNNQQFNLQVFLNEDCKNAQNITDFMKSIQVNLNDLIQTGKLGYVEGMSRIFVKALKDMDITERPFHCTDIKRETVYIKDQDKWSKDEDDKIKIKRTIRNIENKNFRMIPKWQEENPDCMDMESKKSEELTELSIIALGGDEERGRSEKKILKNVLKEVMLDKK